MSALVQRPNFCLRGLREGCSRRKLTAHAILDGVRAGMDHPQAVIEWALRVLGEKV